MAQRKPLLGRVPFPLTPLVAALPVALAPMGAVHAVSPEKPEVALPAELEVSPAEAPEVSPAVAASTIELTAERTVIVPDGRATTVITARVFDSDGKAAPDGTRVRFTTTAGRLDANIASTQNGVARVTLTAPDQPGAALIVAVLDAGAQSVPAQIRINFQADADKTQIDDNWIRIDGKNAVGYVKDYHAIQATGPNGGATFTNRGISITADTLQYRLDNQEILAVGHVTVTLGASKRTYEHLLFNFGTGRGDAERIAENRLVPLQIEGPNLAETPWPEKRNRWGRDHYFLEDLSEGSISVVCQSLGIGPDGTMQFRKATFYLDGKKTFSVPFHVMSQNQESIYQNQIIGLGPQGVTVDFPYYYDVQPRSTGTFYVRHGARLSESAYSARAGWWLDADRSYSLRNGSSGKIELLSLTRPDWSARLQHRQRLDAHTSGSLYMDFPFHRDIFASSQLSRDFKGYNLSGALTGTRYGAITDPITGEKGKAGGYVLGQLTGRTVARPLFRTKFLSYDLNSTVGRQSAYGNSTYTQGVLNSEQVGTRIFTPSLKFARATTVSQSFDIGQTWLQGTAVSGANRSGVSLLGTTNVTRDFGRGQAVTLLYDYSQTPLTSGVNAIFATPRHRLGLNAVFGSYQTVSLNLNGSRALDQTQSNLNATLGIQMGKNWRAEILHYTSQYGAFRYRETQYGLSVLIARRKFSAYYSTTYKRMQFDFGGASF